MSRRNVDYDLLSTFVAVAEEKGFSRAATRLGVGKGTVSRAIAALEAQLGAQLIHRSTHAFSLATAGAALYERTVKHVRALDQAFDHFPAPGSSPTGVFRLTTSPCIGTHLLPEILASFAERYPAVSFELHLTNTVVDLITQGFDASIRAVADGMKPSTLTLRRLGSVTGGFYAAPTYLARRGRPKAMSSDHDWILKASLVQRWKLDRAHVRYVCDDYATMRELASEGAGVAFLPGYFAAPYVRGGTLEAITVSGRALSVPLVLLYPARRQVSSMVVAFRDFLIAWLDKRPLA